MPVKGRTSSPRLRAVSNVAGEVATQQTSSLRRQGGKQVGDGGAGAEPDGHVRLHQFGCGFGSEALVGVDGPPQPPLRSNMDIHQLLGKEADSLLGHTCNRIPKDFLMLPGPDYVDRVMVQSDRSIAVLRNLAQVYDHGRLGGTGYLSILPVDQGVEHSGAASFARNPAYFNPCRRARQAGRGSPN